jgi:hypothetical protein
VNKTFARILKELAREVANHPEVQKKARELATVAARAAGNVAKASYGKASRWLRDRSKRKGTAGPAKARKTIKKAARKRSKTRH